MVKNVRVTFTRRRQEEYLRLYKYIHCFYNIRTLDGTHGSKLYYCMSNYNCHVNSNGAALIPIQFLISAAEGIAAACDVCPSLRKELVAARVGIEVERAAFSELRAKLDDTESDRDRLLCAPLTCSVHVSSSRCLQCLMPV